MVAKCGTSSLTANVVVFELEKLRYKLENNWHDAPGTFEAIELNSGAKFRAKIKPDIQVSADQFKWKQDSTDKGTGSEKDFTFGTEGSTTVSVSVSGSSKSSTLKIGPANGTIVIEWKHEKETPPVMFTSSMFPKRFTLGFSVYGNINQNTWTVRCDKIEGGTKISIAQLGWKTWPANEAEAKEAIDDMVSLCKRGKPQTSIIGKGLYAWHSAAATEAHENVHKLEWTTASEHYWPQVETALEKKALPIVVISTNLRKQRIYCKPPVTVQTIFSIIPAIHTR